MRWSLFGSRLRQDRLEEENTLCCITSHPTRSLFVHDDLALPQVGRIARFFQSIGAKPPAPPYDRAFLNSRADGIEASGHSTWGHGGSLLHANSLANSRSCPRE